MERVYRAGIALAENTVRASTRGEVSVAVSVSAVSVSQTGTETHTQTNTNMPMLPPFSAAGGAVGTSTSNVNSSDYELFYLSLYLCCPRVADADDVTDIGLDHSKWRDYTFINLIPGLLAESLAGIERIEKDSNAEA